MDSSSSHRPVVLIAAAVIVMLLVAAVQGKLAAAESTQVDLLTAAAEYLSYSSWSTIQLYTVCGPALLC